jgi:hypothetical protein
MVFITEKVSEEDIEKYALRDINKKLNSTQEFKWTVGRERDIYLRFIRSNWQEPHEQEFSFYWRGTLLRIILRSLAFEGEHEGVLRQTWEVISFDGSNAIWLPSELEQHREQITNDLKAVLIAHQRDASVPVYTDYVAQFKF